MPAPLPRKALEILAGCPDGTTIGVLVGLGFTPGALALIVSCGYAVTRQVEMAMPSDFRVTWYRITDAGRAALKVAS